MGAMRILRLGPRCYALEVGPAGKWSLDTMAEAPFRVEVDWHASGVLEVGMCRPERPNDAKASRDGYGGDLAPKEALVVAGLLVWGVVHQAARRVWRRNGEG